MALATAREQLFLELINRARLDPVGEAVRYGVDLNKDLPAGTIDANPNQVLAFNSQLNDAAFGHSQWMLNTDTFSHTGSGGTSSNARMRNAGYQFTGSWSSGENLALTYSSGTLNGDADVFAHHQNLILSAGHRKNILADQYREIGVSSITGTFGSYNALMSTHNFASSGTKYFVTGVIYNDTIANDDFYSIGEGVAGRNVEFVVGSSAPISMLSQAAGGYALGTATSGLATISFSGAGLVSSIGATFALARANVKIDAVDGNTILSSVSAALTANTVGLTLIGVTHTSGMGNELANVLTGNNGNNKLEGNGGADTVYGLAGADTIYGGAGADKLVGGFGDDTLYGGADVDYLYGDLGDDEQYGEAGTDFLYGSLGSDLLHGGAGTDWAYYNSSTAPINVNLTSGINTGGFAEGDTLVEIEGIRGSAFNDTMLGGATAVSFYGYAGVDHLTGGGGNDTLVGGLLGDVLNGGGGVDIIRYDSSTAAVIINLTTNTASGGEAQGDTISFIENVVGSGFGDTMTGNSVANVLYGVGGNDRLIGAAGADLLSGGAGSDTFVFSIGDSGQTATTLDKVTDYAKGVVGTGDRFDFTSALAVGGVTTAATVNQASINSTTGVTTFLAGSGISLVDALADIATSMTTGGNAAGDFAFFKVNNTGDNYMFISDGIAGVGSNDVLVQLTAITSIGSINLTSGDLTILT